VSTEGGAAESRQYEAGELIDRRYEVIDLAGYGATSDVYKARDTHGDGVVALKVLNVSRLRDPVAQTRFLREAAVQAMVHHPHVARILGNGVTGAGEPYLVLELFSGRCLRTVLEEQGRVGVEQACAFGLQMLNGLAACHAIGVRHRDLKPENMMMRPTGDGSGEEVVLIDFGFASLEGQERLTAQGYVVGSMSYMAPERLLGEQGDARSDIYGVGVTLFELLTGSKPFEGDDDKELALAHLEKDPPSLREVAPDVDAPVALEAVVRNALAKDPAARYQSAVAMAQALVAVTAAPTARVSEARPLASFALHGYDADGREVRYALGDEPVLIGRAPECAIRSEDPLLSRHHARIYRAEDGQYWIEDLDSTNGVWVGAERATRAAIPPDELVLVGSLVLQVRPIGDDGAEAPLRPGFHTRLWMWLKAERAARLAAQDERNALGHRLGELYQALEHMADGTDERGTKASRKLASEFKVLRNRANELREMVQATEAEKVELVHRLDELNRQLSREIQRRTVESFSAQNDRAALEEELHRTRTELEDARGELEARNTTIEALRQDLRALSEEAAVGEQTETLALIAAQSAKSQLTERVAELELVERDLRTEIADKDAELRDLAARVDDDQAPGRMAELEGQVAELTEEIEQLRWREHQRHSMVARLQVQLDLALAEVGELRSKDTLVGDHNASALSRAEVDRASLGERVAELEGQLDSMRATARAADEEVVRLREQLLGARAEVEAAWAEVEHLRDETGGN
jgi:serine/threonine-protein kinase